MAAEVAAGAAAVDMVGGTGMTGAAEMVGAAEITGAAEMVEVGRDERASARPPAAMSEPPIMRVEGENSGIERGCEDASC